jgi:hypothetical protein
VNNVVQSRSRSFGRRRKESLMNRSVDVVGRNKAGQNQSKSKSKSKSSESSRHSKKKVYSRYVNTYGNDGSRKQNNNNALPLEEMEHLISRYRKDSAAAVVKHSASI